jgi:hypothetical protein
MVVPADVFSPGLKNAYYAMRVSPVRFRPAPMNALQIHADALFVRYVARQSVKLARRFPEAD